MTKGWQLDKENALKHSEYCQHQMLDINKGFKARPGSNIKTYFCTFSQRLLSVGKLHFLFIKKLQNVNMSKYPLQKPFVKHLNYNEHVHN